MVVVGVLVASTAWASERDVARRACTIGASAWDGSAVIGDPGAHAVSMKPFTVLMTAKNKELRRAVRAVVKDPDGERAVRTFGRWCKKHFPTVERINESSFEVPLLSTESG